MDDHSIFLISNKPQSGPTIQRSLYPEEVNYFDGTNYPSFSKLVNSAVSSSETETVIIASDKVRPSAHHVKQIVNLLASGHGFVGLYGFAFFGFKKELMRRIGVFDERYVGGGFEDYDFIVRLIEANISTVITFDVPYISSPSGWGTYDPAYPHWCNKWLHFWKDGEPHPYKLKRNLQEEKYSYDLGESIPVNFLTCKENSYIQTSPHVSPFFFMEIS